MNERCARSYARHMSVKTMVWKIYPLSEAAPVDQAEIPTLVVETYSHCHILSSLFY